MNTVDELSQLFQEYVEALPATSGRELQVRTDLATEVVERLKQLSFILSQVHAVQAALGTTAIVETVAENGERIFVNANFEKDQFNFFALRLLTESYYYFAFRIAKICRTRIRRSKSYAHSTLLEYEWSGTNLLSILKGVIPRSSVKSLPSVQTPECNSSRGDRKVRRAGTRTTDLLQMQRNSQPIWAKS
jgi:hypothetical protein